MGKISNVKIKINSLGPISQSEIDLKPLVIFTGESGLGKSYCAFVVNYLFEILHSNRLEAFFKDRDISFDSLWAKRSPETPFLSILAKDLFDWINRDCVHYVGYLIGNNSLEGNVEIIFPYANEYLEFSYTEELKGLADQEETFVKFILDDFTYNWMGTSPLKVNAQPFMELIKASLQECIFNDFRAVKRVFVFPPARASLVDINERPAFTAGMYHKFFNFKALAALPFDNESPDKKVVVSLLSELNEGSISRKDDKLLFVLNDGKSIPLSAAASSVKELAPLSILLDKFPIKGTSVLFEEPEAHLHPSRQEKLADIISLFIRKNGFMQITSHSDYFIKRLNTLIKLNQLCAKIKDQVTKKEILTNFDALEDFLLPKECVAAYIVKKVGKGSEVVSLNIDENDEIPYESFYKVIENNIKLGGILRDLENQDNGILRQS